MVTLTIIFFTNAGKTEPSEMVPRDVYALPEYNWQDEMYRTAYAQDHNLSVTGGTKYTKFLEVWATTKKMACLSIMTIPGTILV